jgi:hypothetical protein
MTFVNSSTFLLARPKVPSYRRANQHSASKNTDGERETYPLLGELAGTLVLGVTEQLDDAALVGGETIISISAGRESTVTERRSSVPSNLLDDLANERGALGEVTLAARDLGLGVAGGELVVALVEPVGET